jgi:release factor glutamine methyltransferase
MDGEAYEGAQSVAIGARVPVHRRIEAWSNVAVPVPHDRAALVAMLSESGFVAPEEEADELLSAAAAAEGTADAAGDELLNALLARRLTGEPLEWIVGRMSFCDMEIRVDRGVYVPRRQSEALARQAAVHLPAEGTAIDLCTGTGAIAKVLATSHPRARVVASDLDGRAVACARSNGVEAYEGDLFAPLPPGLAGGVDVIVGVVPYVPTSALTLLHHDALAFESRLSYDGGPDGTEILRRVLTESPRFLRPGGVVLLELGGEQADLLRDDLERLGYREMTILFDEDGDVRGVVGTLPRP